MRAKTDALDYNYVPPPGIVIHALKGNKRPVGFAPWPKEKKKRKGKK
jgi:hypothetical protein